MARRRKKHSSGGHARRALAVRPSVVVVGGGGGRRRSRGGGGRRARIIHRGKSAAKHGLHATGLGVGGALLGYMQGAGHLDWVPAIMGSKTIGMGLLGFAATRMVKNKYVREAGAAAVAVAGFEFGREHGGSTGSKPGVRGPGWAGGGLGPFAGG